MNHTADIRSVRPGDAPQLAHIQTESWKAACNRCAQNSQKQASAPGCYGKAYTCATKHASFYAQAGDAGSLANQIPKQRINDGSSCADHANENRC